MGLGKLNRQIFGDMNAEKKLYISIGTKYKGGGNKPSSDGFKIRK